MSVFSIGIYIAVAVDAAYAPKYREMYNYWQTKRKSWREIFGFSTTNLAAVTSRENHL